MGRDPVGGMPAAKGALAYLASVNGTIWGEVLDGRDYV
jgi:hypothetical protein